MEDETREVLKSAWNDCFEEAIRLSESKPASTQTLLKVCEAINDAAKDLTN